MRKIINNISFLKHYFVEYQPFILLSFILLGTLFMLSRLQYFILFLTLDNIVIIFWITIVLLFWPPVKFSFILSIIFCFVAYFSSLFDVNVAAEQIGNIIYFLLVIGFSQMLFSYLKTEGDWK